MAKEFDQTKLKPGDEVCVFQYGSYSSQNPESIHVIRSISPTGKITLDNDHRFANGCRRAGGSTQELRSVTDDIRERIERREILQRLWNIDREIKKLPTDALRAIDEIMAAHKNKESS